MSDYFSHEDMMSIAAREVSDPSKLAANPVVSVIMITYNHDKYVEQAIKGIITQRCDFPIELLIGEDCSTDRTRDICVEYQKRYPNLIRLITGETNVGMHKNMFRLYARARGRYLAFCEGDDYWCDETKLAKQIRLLDSRLHLSMCFSRGGIVRGSNPALVQDWYPRSLKEEYTIKDFISVRVGAPTCTVVYRNGLVPRFPTWLATCAVGDWPTHILHLAKGNAGYINDRLGIYRQHSGGLWASASAQDRLQGMLDCCSELDSHLEGKYRRHFNVTIARLYVGHKEAEMTARSAYGCGHLCRAIRALPVSPLRAPRTLMALILHVGFPKTYKFLKRARVIRRMNFDQD
ncbi:MAG: glycosyltransferase [Verrucomicrobiota bacterium]|jgi:glycosyltransferase involved in cell wall biosynthesis